MALIVNQNISSINAQRNLTRSQKGLNQSLERLSSGMRINRAGDDAAGLAISEGLRAQVRGLNMAVRNANDGISLINTAEGAIQEVTNIFQRIRELSVQAANDTNSPANRASLQLEVDQLIEELGRIAENINFNGRNLFDGTFTDMKLHVGAQKDQNISITIADLRPARLGAVAQHTSDNPTAPLLNGGDLIINGIPMGITESDGVSHAGGDMSAIAYANMINAKTGETGVEAEILPNTVTGDAAVGPVTILDGDLKINGVSVPAVTVQANDSDAALVNAINSVSNQTNVTASIQSGELKLTTKDGQNIHVDITTNRDPVGPPPASDAQDALRTALGMDTLMGTDTVTNFVGSYKLISDKLISVSGVAVLDAGLQEMSIPIDFSTAVNQINISTQAGANDAILMADYALRQITMNRAELGAISNRLDMTVSNLMTVSENLAASESQIRDADFALETATLTKNQILQQAGVAILAQANQLPQAALSLLQG